MSDQYEQLANAVADDIAYGTTTALQSHKPSWRLGPSTVSGECEREAVYKFRWFNHVIHSARMLRLFERGNEEESRLVRWLRMAGWRVFDRDPATGNQWRYSTHNDHFAGMIDAKLMHDRYGDAVFLGEFKTHNTKSFTNFVNEDLEKAKPEHADQMSMYGALDGEFSAAIYIAVNKNDDDVTVRVRPFDLQRGRSLIDKAHRIVHARQLPRRISDKASFYKCKMCDFQEHCHSNLPAAVNCRSCRHAVPIEGSSWFCGHHNVSLTREQVHAACPSWEQFQ